MFRNVLERRRELALLRAVGYDRRHVRLMILAETHLPAARRARGGRGLCADRRHPRVALSRRGRTGRRPGSSRRGDCRRRCDLGRSRDTGGRQRTAARRASGGVDGLGARGSGLGQTLQSCAGSRVPNPEPRVPTVDLIHPVTPQDPHIKEHSDEAFAAMFVLPAARGRSGQARCRSACLHLRPLRRDRDRDDEYAARSGSACGRRPALVPQPCRRVAAAVVRRSSGVTSGGRGPLVVTVRDLKVAIATAVVVVAGMSFTRAQTPVLSSRIFDWDSLKVGRRKSASAATWSGRRRPRSTSSRCTSRRSTPAQQSHPPHQHAAEELLIIKEGTLEALVNGEYRKVGPARSSSRRRISRTPSRTSAPVPRLITSIQWQSPGMMKK